MVSLSNGFLSDKGEFIFLEGAGFLSGTSHFVHLVLCIETLLPSAICPRAKGLVQRAQRCRWLGCAACMAWL